MEKLLKFNICGLESSFLLNNEVEGLEDRVKENIPAHLRYASLHWAHHLAECDDGHALRKSVSAFLYNRVLHWVEVLSLLEQTDAADEIMADASHWLTQVKAELHTPTKTNDSDSSCHTTAQGIRPCQGPQ